MRVRRVDQHHDWTFGQGHSNYAIESEAIAQNVKTRLWSFTQDWFLDLEHGLPWLDQAGKRVNRVELDIKLKRYVLETEGVAYIKDYQADFLPDTRVLTINIDYVDIFETPHTVSYATNITEEKE